MKIEKEVICSSQLGRAGAGPDWSGGNTTIVRVGDRVFATAMLDVMERMPYNSHLLCLYEKKGDNPWERVYCDEDVWQREPCPIMYLGNNLLAVTINPTTFKHDKEEDTRGAQCTPMVYIFDISEEVKKVKTFILPYELAGYRFMDHSYRSMGKDIENGNLLFINEYGDYAHHYATGIGMFGQRGSRGKFCYVLLDNDLRIIRQGQLERVVEENIAETRILYNTIGMRDNEVYILGKAGCVEPNEEYREYKYEQTGVRWDYDLSRLFLYYSPDITKEEIKPIGFICDKFASRGWLEPVDCCYDTNGDMLFLVSEENVHHAFMRDKFFPEVPLETVLKVCRYSRGKLVEETIIDRYLQEGDIKVTYWGFFQTASDGEVYLVWSKQNNLWDKPGEYRNGEYPPAYNAATYLTKVDALEQEPIKIFDVAGRIFGNKTRLGALPGDIIDVYSSREDEAIYYSRCDLNEVLGKD